MRGLGSGNDDPPGFARLRCGRPACHRTIGMLGWAPSTPLQDGMEKTYRWVYDQVKARSEGRRFIGG